MLWELPNIRGTLFWAHNKDPTVLEIFFRVPYFRKLPYQHPQRGIVSALT